MAENARYPQAASLYEAIRTHPGALARLGPFGVTRDLLDLSLADAARQLHVSMETLSEAIDAPEAAKLAESR